MLGQKLALSYGSRIILQFVQIIVTIFVARVAGPTVLGTIAFGMAFVNMFAFIADLGIPTAYIKCINDGDNEAEANGTYLRLQLGLIGLFFITVTSWLLIQKYGFKYQFESKTHEIVIIIFIAALTLQRLYQSVKTIFIARTEQAKQDIPDFIFTLIYQIFRLSVVLIGYRAIAIALSNLAATVLILPLYIFLLRPYPIGKFNKVIAKKYYKIALPVILILIAQTVLMQSDKVILQYFANSESVGLYTAGFRIGGFVQMIANIVGVLFFPMFTKAIAENNTQLINVIIRKFERFMFAFIFPATIIAAIYSDVIVKIILGDLYLPTIPILSIITISMFILTLFQPYGNAILAKGRFYHGALVYSIQLIFFILLVILFLNLKSLNNKGLGVAWAVLLSNILLGILFVYFSKKNITQLIILPSFKLALYALVVSITAYVIYISLGESYIMKGIFGVFFFIVFWGLGSLLKIIKLSDWSMLFNIINLRKLIRYIKTEVLDKNENN